MPVDGETREYTWEDVVCLVLKDMGLEPEDRQHHTVWYIGGFTPPEHPKDECLRVTKYKQDFNARLDERVRDKL